MLKEHDLWDLDAELILLGTMLVYDEIRDTVFEMLDSDDFGRNVHQGIYTVIKEMHQSNEAMNLVTLAERCIAKKVLDKDTARNYIDSLTRDLFPPAHIETTAAIIKNYSIRRKTLGLIRNATVQMTDIGEDPRDVSRHVIEQLEKLSVSQASGSCRISELFGSFWERYNHRAEDIETKLYSSGIPTLDKLFGKLGEGRLVIFKGRRGTGKTHTMIQMSMKCAEHKRTAVIFSYEMSKYQLMERYISNAMSIDSIKLRHVTDESANAIANSEPLFQELDIHLYEAGGMKVSDIRTTCRALISKGCDIGFVGVDFIELITGSANKTFNQEQQLAHIARELKTLAIELNATVFVLSQVNTAGTERGSESIGNLADCLLHCSQNDDKKTGKLIAEKNRFGPGFIIEVGMDLTTSTIWEITNR